MTADQAIKAFALLQERDNTIKLLHDMDKMVGSLWVSRAIPRYDDIHTNMMGPVDIRTLRIACSLRLKHIEEELNELGVTES